MNEELENLQKQIKDLKEWMGERRKRIEKAFELIERNSKQISFVQQELLKVKEKE